ncbi:undecaprenyl-phosphate glucose phosphotransferase [Vibrio sp. Of7-15]|uniref:undecaprenyl-phosphate glucose phosphotransferase n=1 Tax=Vibrio sp. Of7-15 TaxID=2724879 RepID=UPI001EF20316|nr:undecaprenyl-phosphate glucose phosphotransferase [Vibrio sp. Of7-15]MCG7498516.1 undecaprenyl-phosphate glucose phosphotransferase [Vibrio sp. Of7-15]
MEKKGLIRSHETEFAFLYRLTDVIFIASTLYVIASFYLNTFTQEYLLAGALGVLSFLLAAESSNLYRSWRISSFKEQVSATILPWIFSISILLTLGYFSKTSEIYSRVAIGSWFLITPLILVGWRYLFKSALKALRKKGFNKRQAAIIGVTDTGLALAKELKRKNSLGIELVGFYDERAPERLKSQMDLPLLGSVSDALQKAKEGEIEHVYIAMPMHANHRIAQFLTQFSDTTANTYLVPDFFTYNLLHSRWHQVGNIHTLSVHDTPFNGLTGWVKRAEDIVLALIIIALISPVLLIVALGVKLSSPGPILFKQNRYGLDGRKIKVWKFRSMNTMDNGSVVKQATKNDPRITPFGAFIRRTSLDELPQFFNVLQGKMSIVGPRPHAVAHNEEYREIVERYMLRHKVKPGITGWAQINGYRGETDTLDKMEKRVEFDLAYIQGWSLWMDLKIVFLTVFKGFVGKAAY